MSLDTSKLTPQDRLAIARKLGGYSLHRKHPDAAKKNGAKGGAAFVANNPHVKSSAHGKALAAARRAKQKNAALRQLAEDEVMAGRASKLRVVK